MLMLLCGACFGAVSHWFCKVWQVCHFTMSVLSSFVSETSWGVCVEGVDGGPFSQLKVLLLFFYAIVVLSSWGASCASRGSGTRAGTNEMSVGCILEGCIFQGLLGPLLVSQPILHPDSVGQIYGNRRFPCLNALGRKCVLQVYDFARHWQ